MRWWLIVCAGVQSQVSQWMSETLGRRVLPSLPIHINWAHYHKRVYDLWNITGEPSRSCNVKPIIARPISIRSSLGKAYRTREVLSMNDPNWEGLIEVLGLQRHSSHCSQGINSCSDSVDLWFSDWHSWVCLQIIYLQPLTMLDWSAGPVDMFDLWACGVR